MSNSYILRLLLVFCDPFIISIPWRQIRACSGLLCTNQANRNQWFCSGRQILQLSRTLSAKCTLVHTYSYLPARTKEIRVGNQPDRIEPPWNPLELREEHESNAVQCHKHAPTAMWSYRNKTQYTYCLLLHKRWGKMEISIKRILHLQIK